ncbi:hypothetical protein SAMN02799630_01474 [Paenibacillus sp. UNCCL117]|uniref:hypothetical protein n=1 Tax=unclassified Paenibacillus TaxID=185978 RepID=UPI0008867297|nr:MULTISPECIES: hypothetical protein [unclassified Paenibacillus]SDC78263.1 hypothetical protein SAMN04488602_103453 [Paenibacillus sp. cl123]SFW26027.1 hypothetical protein SAMN02799630_01474 [Paenibacillus sp. UNCCL117]
MKSTHASKVIISTLALTLLLGGGALYGGIGSASAEDKAVAAPSAGTDEASEDTAGQSSPRSWFGRGEDKEQDKTSKEKAEAKKEGAGKHHGPQAIIEEAAGVLGIPKDELKISLQNKTLVEVAQERGVSEADLIAKLKAVRIAQLDQAVASGKLTADQAALMKEKLEKHLTFLVNHNLTKLGKHGPGHKSRMLPAPDKLASILGMTEDELKAQLKEGKSLTEIAAGKGITKEQLIGKIKDELTPWIEKAVDRKHSENAKPKK